MLIIGKRPTLKNTKAAIKEMVFLYGDLWITEPVFDNIDFDQIVDKRKAMMNITNGNIDWGNVLKKAKPIAEKYYDLIF